jgi:hypothetical protein
MSSNVADILKQLDTLNQQSGVAVYVPSLKRTVKFKALNLRQQKNLLKSSVEETLTKLSFITNFYSIIQENILETLNINDLYIFDRIAIAIALRATSIDSKYTIEDSVFDLNDKLKEIPSVVIDTDTISTIVDIQNFTVALEVPRLGIDRDISATVMNKIRSSQSDDIRTLIGELFIHEIIKFVKTVTFKTEAGDTVVEFANIKTEDKLAIIEKFPTLITNQILDFIKKYRELENKFTGLDDNAIEIDGSFFTI